MFYNWDPGRVSVTFNGIMLIGFMDGTFVSAERAEDAFSTQVGAAGDVTRVRSRNRTGSVTVTLQAGSPANDLLSAMAAQDELFGTGVGELIVKDANGKICEASEAWIKKLPTIEMSMEASGREWVLECAQLIVTPLGSATVV